MLMMWSTRRMAMVTSEMNRRRESTRMTRSVTRMTERFRMMMWRRRTMKMMILVLEVSCCVFPVRAFSLTTCSLALPFLSQFHLSITVQIYPKQERCSRREVDVVPKCPLARTLWSVQWRVLGGRVYQAPPKKTSVFLIT